MNKFFFFSPFHLKIYIRVINNIVSSINTTKRPINIFLYGPNDDVVKYIDSLGCFKQVESNRYCKISYSEYIENYEYVIYSSI